MEKDYKKTGWVNGSEPDMDAEHMNNIEDGIDGLYHPVFDDSGTVEGITNFPQFLSTVVNKMNPIAFYKNFKAGMAFVLHAGQLVNNGLCNEPGKYPLDAAYGKTLYDYYDRLNSDFANHVVALSDGSVALQAKEGNVVKRLQIHGWDNNVSYFYSDDGGLTWTEGVALLKASDLRYQLRADLGGADVCTLPAGRWCANNGLANGELGYWYVDIVEFDSRYRTIHVYPYEAGKKYFYYAKMVDGVWLGWEKYNSVI